MLPAAQFEKYRKPLKKQCIMEIVAAGVALLAIVFLLFVPNFTIALTDGVFEGILAGTTLPKLNDPEILTSKSITFSVFDEVYAIIAPVKTDDSVGKAIGFSFGILQIIGLVFLAIGLVMAAISAVKGILHIVKPNDYALEMYDKLKHRTEGRQRRGFQSSPMYWVLMGIVYEVIAIVMSSYLSRMIGDIGGSGDSGGARITSYFSVLSGISAGGVFTIIFIIATIVLFIISRQMLKKIRLSIMRDDYTEPLPSQRPDEPFLSYDEPPADGRSENGGSRP